MCYEFKSLEFSNGILDNNIDITYIIHLENNGRYKNIMEQLNIFKPTKKVYICFNKGYKNCKKSEKINKSNLDLVDTYINILKHAENNGYKNALIFEDDFMFSDNILNINYTKSVNKFLSEHKDEEFVYMLGNLPTLQIPSFNSDTSLLIIGLGTHACFYSEKLIKKIVKDNHENILDWDDYLRNYRRYNFKLPLCYQLFPITENYNNWTDVLSTRIIKKIIKINNLDTKAEPGYGRMYWFSYFLFYVLVFIFLILCIGFHISYSMIFIIRKNYY